MNHFQKRTITNFSQKRLATEEKNKKKITPAGYPRTMQSEVHLGILQILDRSNMQCPTLTYHLVQEDI